MGLFDRLAGSKEEPLSPQAGLLLSAITMVAADGDVDDEELAVIRRLDGGKTTDAWEAAVKTWKGRSIEECISLAAHAMNQGQRLVAMANLIDIAMADGSLQGREKQLLEAYIGAFGLEISEIEKIVDVVSIKNNKTVFNQQ